MALFKAKQVAAGAPLLHASGARDLVPVFGDFVVPAGLAANDIVEMLGLPADYVPVDLIVDHQSMAGTTFTADVGILTGVYGAALNLAGAARDCGAEFIAAGAFAAAGLKRASAVGFTRIAPVNDAGNGLLYDRGIGFKATTVTGLTAGANIRFTLLMRPKLGGV